MVLASLLLDSIPPFPVNLKHFFEQHQITPPRMIAPPLVFIGLQRGEQPSNNPRHDIALPGSASQFA
jgi:hypothetical protein